MKKSFFQTFCLFNLCFHFSEQSLSQIYQPLLPAPVGLWPLSKALGPVDVTTNKIPSNESWIAYDPLYTPAGLLGSPLFTKELNDLSFIQIFPSSKMASPASKQISILGWIRPDAVDEGTVLVKYIFTMLTHKKWYTQR